ncbi:hypothetical protein [Aquibacillus saliphilus]|uniref:hypothetical protein n=1 Tax=Aquibacillus saliphilus TaxID=1909422 RepID=UPI001CF091E2|nr:hypothetical protein [Aquibacillus saliphilus]
MHCYTTKTKAGAVRWVCIEDGPADPVTGKRKQIVRRGKSKGEAKRRVEQVENLYTRYEEDEKRRFRKSQKPLRKRSFRNKSIKMLFFRCFFGELSAYNLHKRC